MSYLEGQLGEGETAQSWVGIFGAQPPASLVLGPPRFEKFLGVLRSSGVSGYKEF